MVRYPVHVPRVSYRGSNPTRRQAVNEKNRIAELIEDHLNELILKQKHPTQIYLYGYIAIDLGIDEKIVRELCYGIDGGSGGLTVMKPEMTFE